VAPRPVHGRDGGVRSSSVQLSRDRPDGRPLASTASKAVGQPGGGDDVFGPGPSNTVRSTAVVDRVALGSAPEVGRAGNRWRLVGCRGGVPCPAAKGSRTGRRATAASTPAIRGWRHMPRAIKAVRNLGIGSASGDLRFSTSSSTPPPRPGETAGYNAPAGCTRPGGQTCCGLVAPARTTRSGHRDGESLWNFRVTRPCHTVSR